MGLGVEAELVCPPGLGGETGPEDGPAEGLCTLEALYPLHWPVHHPAPLLPQNVHSVRIWIPQLHILTFVHKVLIHVELQLKFLYLVSWVGFCCCDRLYDQQLSGEERVCFI